MTDTLIDRRDLAFQLYEVLDTENLTTRERFRRRFVEGSVCWCSSHCISADRS